MLDQDLSFFQRVEDLRVQELIAKLAVEAFTVTVLPRAARLDEQRADVQPCQPLPNRLGAELGPIVRSDVVWRAMGNEQLGKQRQHVIAVEPPGDQDRQTFPAELVDHHQHAKYPAVMGAILDEIVGPDMMAPARPKPDAGSIVQPKSTPLGLSLRHLQALLTPDPLHTLGIHMPALTAQQGRDPTVAVAAILAGQFDNRFGKRRLVVGDFGYMPLGRARLTKNTAGPTFGNTECLLNMMHAAPTTLGAQKFPEAASFRISLSRVRSATALRSRAFSRSSAFSRFA